jgi:hypothetical protein
MSVPQPMPGPDGVPVSCYSRSARQVRAGDWLPDYGGHATTDAVEDPDDGSIWWTLDDGRDIRHTRRKVWLHRRYSLTGWQRDAVSCYRDARDARTALRESSASVTADIAGTAGANVGAYQLSDAEFAAAYPAPRLADFLRDAAGARRKES